MEIVNVAIEDLKPYKNNPRNNDKAVDFVANSIKEFGFKVPIVIDKNNEIVAGHTRYRASKKLKLKTVPCIIADDLTDEQIKAFRLADNKVAEQSNWDLDKLDLEIYDIDFDMSKFGFDATISEEDYDTNFELPANDKGEFEQITFTLHNKQAELIRYAIEIIINNEEIEETFGNTNKNANAIYEVVRQWAEQRK